MKKTVKNTKAVAKVKAPDTSVATGTVGEVVVVDNTAVEETTVTVEEQDEDTVTVGDEVTLVSPETEAKAMSIAEEDEEEEFEEEYDTPEVVVEVVKPSAPVQPKQVKIRMRENHRCYIGGSWYNLTKGKEYNVPAEVKDILAEAGLLLPL